MTNKSVVESIVFVQKTIDDTLAGKIQWTVYGSVEVKEIVGVYHDDSTATLIYTYLKGLPYGEAMYSLRKECVGKILIDVFLSHFPGRNWTEEELITAHHVIVPSLIRLGELIESRKDSIIVPYTFQEPTSKTMDQKSATQSLS